MEEVRKEIQDSFQGRQRAKRLLRPTDGEQEEISENQGSLSTNRAKASRKLQFSSANTSSTTCASFCSQELLFQKMSILTPRKITGNLKRGGGSQ